MMYRSRQGGDQPELFAQIEQGKNPTPQNVYGRSIAAPLLARAYEIISVWFFLPVPRNAPLRDCSDYCVIRAAQPPPGARCTFSLVDLFTVDFFIL